MHGLNETILAKTHAWLKETSDSYQLCLKNVHPQRHSFNATRMRNKHRQSHNFWSLKSSIQIMHKTSSITFSNGDWISFANFMCRPSSGGNTDEGRRETGENRGGRREIMTGEKGGVIGREKGG